MVGQSEGSAAIQRASKRQWALKPQDLAVALKLVALRGEWLPYRELGKAMFLSQFEAHAAIQRLLAARLAREDGNAVRPIAKVLHPFFVHGAAYGYPAIRTNVTIGFATAHGALPLKNELLFADQFPPVWPHPEGPDRGPGLLPLYEKAPLAAKADGMLYQLLALFDALRIGQAREREMAGNMLAERMK